MSLSPFFIVVPIAKSKLYLCVLLALCFLAFDATYAISQPVYDSSMSCNLLNRRIDKWSKSVAMSEMRRKVEMGEAVDQKELDTDWVNLENYPSDRQKVFEFALASWRKFSPQMSYSQYYSLLIRPFWALNNLPFQPEYEMVRINFLITALLSASSQLAPVGKSLLHVNKNDSSVRFQLSYCLNSEGGNSNEALWQAMYLVRNGNDKISAYALLADNYFGDFLANEQNTQLALKALAAYKKYLSLAPKNDSYRAEAQKRIGFIQRKMQK